MEKSIQEAIDKVSQEGIRLGIDFERSSPFGDYQFVEVEFPSADMDVTIRHKILGKGEIVAIPVRWEFTTAPGTSPTIYSILGTPKGNNYIKVRSTIAGKALLLLGLRRDS